MQTSATAVSLRGVSAVSDKIAWASGAKGTVLRTVDGGASWEGIGPPNVSDLDFRDIEAVNDRIAFAMSSGEGRASRIYKTTDGGMSWTMLRTNQDPAGFWDSIAMWDATHGILLGDPVNGRFTILVTSDGVAWTTVEGPKSEKGEAAFAASGTALIVRGTRDAWFATGGDGGGRIFHSEDAGKTWTAVRTPLKASSDGSGIFSVAPSAARMIAVGGNYMKPEESQSNIAISEEGKWIVPPSRPRGYRSAVAYLPARKAWIVVGTSGSDISFDDGHAWHGFDDGGFNSVSVTADGAVWAVGPDGRIAKLLF
jgi:photosystem II stability/assembly factor-like uncharacterized protein